MLVRGEANVRFTMLVFEYPNRYSNTTFGSVLVFVSDSTCNYVHFYM